MRDYEKLIIDLSTRELKPKEKEHLIQFLHGQREIGMQEYKKYEAALDMMDKIRPRRR